MLHVLILLHKHTETCLLSLHTISSLYIIVNFCVTTEGQASNSADPLLYKESFDCDYILVLLDDFTVTVYSSISMSYLLLSR